MSTTFNNKNQLVNTVTLSSTQANQLLSMALKETLDKCGLDLTDYNLMVHSRANVCVKGMTLDILHDVDTENNFMVLLEKLYTVEPLGD